MPNFLYRWLTFHVFLQVAEFFYNDRILGQAGRKIGESVGSISRGPTPGARPNLVSYAQAEHTRKGLMRTLSMRISSLRACSVNTSVPDAYAQHSFKALFEFGIFTLMLSIRIRN